VVSGGNWWIYIYIFFCFLVVVVVSGGLEGLLFFMLFLGWFGHLTQPQPIERHNNN